MKTISKQFSRTTFKRSPGFASILVVLSTGLALMIMLMLIYEDTAQSQKEQKNNLLANDYRQREDAVLRALTNILPNKAIRCMQDDSRKNSPEDCNWESVFVDSIAQANAAEAISSDTLATIGVDASKTRSANVADTNSFDINVVASSVKEPNSDYYVSEGTDRHFTTVTAEYPPPVKFQPSNNEECNTGWPVISNVKVYDSGVVTGWIDQLSNDKQFGLLPSPSPYFKYGDNGKIIAKQNWWTFNLNFSRHSKDAEEEETYKNDRELRQTTSKQYIVSIYEIPSQLAINASSYIEIGGTNWENGHITVAGGVFAEEIKNTGSFSPAAIASRKGVKLQDGTSAMSSSERDDALAKGTAYTISSSSDAGKISFIPINRGLEFYDRFAANDGQTVTNSYDTSGNVQNQYVSSDGYTQDSLVSPTSWNYYSIGANQCAMNLVVTNVTSSDDQTPTEIEFTYLQGGTPKTRTYTTDLTAVNDVDIFEWKKGDSSMPFTTGITNIDGRPALELSLEKLQILLTTLGADNASINHSISVNVDYVNNANILKPYRDGLVDNTTNPVYNKDLCLILKDSDNLATDAAGAATYTNGFSLVTNLRMIFADNVNTTPLPGGSDYPPMSIFSPEKIFGDSSYAAVIDIEGQLTSITKKADKSVADKDKASAIADLYSGKDGTTNNSNSIKLKGITDPTKLPPINMMNWMVVVKEKHN